MSSIPNRHAGGLLRGFPSVLIVLVAYSATSRAASLCPDVIYDKYYDRAANALAACHQSLTAHGLPITSGSCQQDVSKPLFSHFYDVVPSTQEAINGCSSGAPDAERWRFNFPDGGCALGRVADAVTGECRPVLPSKDEGPPQCPISNPVAVASGNKYQAETDWVGSGVFPLSIVRSFNSNSGTWRFMPEIRPDAAGTSVLVVRRDGRGLTYTADGNGGWVGDPDVHHGVESIEDGNGTLTGWRLTTTDNTLETYTATGLLLSVADSRGNVQTVTYDADNRPDRIEAATGEYLQFSHDALGRVTTIADQAGNTWGYRYDLSNNLQYVDNPDGTTRRYHYAGVSTRHLLRGITDERGIRYSTYGYDSEGRTNLSTHAGDAERVDIVYNADGTRAVTNSLGQTTTYSTTVQLGASLVTGIDGPGCSTCGAGDTNYVRDPATNNLLERTADGVTTRYGNYDAKGQKGCMTEGIDATDTASGACAFDPAVSPDARRVDYTYDGRFFHKVTSVTEPSVSP